MFRLIGRKILNPYNYKSAYLAALFLRGVSKYSSPFSLISYMVERRTPSFPAGNPFWLNQSK